MTWVAAAVITVGGNLIGSSMQANAAENAANLQYRASQDAARQQREMFDILNEQQKPYREAGYGALSKIQEMLPQFTKMPTEAELLAIPGVKFGLTQGLGATGQGMNVSSPGSNVDMARTKFATDYGVSTALPAWRNMQTDIYNRLSNLAGIGQTSQGQANQIGTTTAANLAQLGTSGASALGAGQIGAANAYAGGLQNIGNAGMLYSFLKPQTNSLGNVPSGGFGSALDQTFFRGTTGVAD